MCMGGHAACVDGQAATLRHSGHANRRGQSSTSENRGHRHRTVHRPKSVAPQRRCNRVRGRGFGLITVACKMDGSANGPHSVCHQIIHDWHCTWSLWRPGVACAPQVRCKWLMPGCTRGAQGVRGTRGWPWSVHAARRSAQHRGAAGPHGAGWAADDRSCVRGGVAATWWWF